MKMAKSIIYSTALIILLQGFAIAQSAASPLDNNQHRSAAPKRPNRKKLEPYHCRLGKDMAQLIV
ncbi:MAG: hypothetical protein AB1489_34340, partial [Acidobacteriota bacterium]